MKRQKLLLDRGGNPHFTEESGQEVRASDLEQCRDRGGVTDRDHLVNSLLVGVANPGYYSGVSVGIESTGAGVFEPADDAKDTGQVDIELHYVATANGQPIDTDGDGLPDYVEDANGDGQVGATETDPSNVDTDGDELSDGAEVEVTGTDPLDPASKNHNREYVRYSSAHPLWKSAQSSGTGVMTTEAKLLVARGVDALRLYVEVSTTEPASTRPTYNDHLTNIDLFVWALRHELSHHLNWMRFWAPDDVPMHGHWRDRDHHKHVQFLGDWLPDDQEWYMGAEGGPFNPTLLDSHPGDGYSGMDADTERHNCNSIHGEEWTEQMRTQSHNWDWAKPGKNWPHP